VEIPDPFVLIERPSARCAMISTGDHLSGAGLRRSTWGGESRTNARNRPAVAPNTSSGSFPSILLRMR
jgi:hypothetical protein